MAETATTDEASAPGEDVGDAPQSLSAIVRGWRWALPLAMAGVVLRWVAVGGIRLYRYYDSGEYETLDFSGRWRRPWTTPLLYDLLPDDDASVVTAQALIGAVSWLVLAFALAALFRRRPVQIGVAVAVVALGCTSVVTNWDATMLSEPMALSLTVLVLAAWTDFVRRPSELGALWIVVATVPWMFVRQSLMPTAWLTLLFAAVALVALLVRKSDRRAVTPLAFVVVGLLLGCVWATISYGRNTEILHHNITAIVADRIAPDDDRRDWFVERGMPLPADGRLDYSGFDQDAAFQAWVSESGTSTYARFLAQHPWYALTEPLEDFVGANRSYQEVPPFSDPMAPPVSMLAPAEPYGSSRNVLPDPVEDLLLRGGAVGTVLTALVVVTGWAIVRRRDIDRRWIVPLATIVLAAASLYAAWHGASTELPRLGLPAAVALRIALIAMFGLLVEAELDRRARQACISSVGMTDGPLTYADLAGFDVTAVSALASQPKKVARLRELGIDTILDLVTTYPRRHIDRSREASIRGLVPGDQAMVVGKVARISSRRTRGRPPRTLVTAEVGDGTGYLRISFFNQGWREKQLPPGTEAVFFGKVDTFQGRLQMANPVVDFIGDKTGRIIPLYPQSEKPRITSEDVAGWIATALGKTRARGLAEPLPEPYRKEWGLIGRADALWGIHAPEAMADVTAARTRLVFDELLRVQVALVLRKRALERTAKGIVHDTSGDLVRRFHEALPYPLTGAQRRVIDEITDDLGGPHPMHRLLQGDVGAGKTVVAVSALLVAIQGGHQGALMAPTEVLAEQHFLGIRELLADLRVAGDAEEGSLFEGLAEDRPLRVELLTNRTTAANRRKLAEALADGSVDLLIGTHALIEDAVAFRSLGVVVIDEQHRFGVEQRDALRQKGAEGATPDVLVMTATPIPRTAAMTVYGDLDVSVLDELPPGRTPIRTRWVEAAADDDEATAEVWDHVRAEVAAGRQAYVVCPLVEESEKLEVSSAQETHDRLAATELSGLRLGLLHGRMPSADKEVVMAAFRAGDLDVLVATTVIEVGVDVPNATVMVILDADRFGIAQLHQLRGRVGRGADASTCWLVGAGTTPDGRARLEAMVRTTDGFELAEVDLDLRGEGTLMGERQKGRNDLKLASLRRDRVWVARARQVAFDLIDGDPDLSGHPALRDEVGAFLADEDADFLLKS